MVFDLTTVTDALLTSGVVTWLGLRIVKQVDSLDERLKQYETRLTIAEKEIECACKGKQD